MRLEPEGVEIDEAAPARRRRGEQEVGDLEIAVAVAARHDGHRRQRGRGGEDVARERGGLGIGGARAVGRGVRGEAREVRGGVVDARAREGVVVDEIGDRAVEPADQLAAGLGPARIGNPVDGRAVDPGQRAPDRRQRPGGGALPRLLVPGPPVAGAHQARRHEALARRGGW